MICEPRLGTPAVLVRARGAFGGHTGISQRSGRRASSLERNQAGVVSEGNGALPCEHEESPL